MSGILQDDLAVPLVELWSVKYQTTFSLLLWLALANGILRLTSDFILIAFFSWSATALFISRLFVSAFEKTESRIPQLRQIFGNRLKAFYLLILIFSLTTLPCFSSDLSASSLCFVTASGSGKDCFLHWVTFGGHFLILY